MQKLFTTFLLSFFLVPAFSQTPHKVSVYLQGQYNKTIYDRTIGNNPWSVGLGLQAWLNTASLFKPTVDFTADVYLENDKVLQLNPDDTPVDNIGGMVNLFAGASYHPSGKAFFSFVTGPSLISGQTLLGIKPSFGFYLSSTQRWIGKVSYINIFNRDKKTNRDFGSLSLSLGVRLF